MLVDDYDLVAGATNPLLPLADLSRRPATSACT